MTPIEIILVGLIASIVGHGVILIFRSPKDIFRALEEKIDEIEQNHNTLDRMLTRHDEVVKNLVSAIDRLTHRIDRIEPILGGRPQHGRRGA